MENICFGIPVKVGVFGFVNSFSSADRISALGSECDIVRSLFACRVYLCVHSVFGFVLLASGSTSFFLVSLALLDGDFSKWVPQSIGRRFVSYCQLSDGYVHGRNACHGVWAQRVHRPTVAETRLKDLVYDSIAVELVDLALQLLSLASQFVSR